MPAEGMVDALHRAHRLLGPDGRLVDIRPTREAAHLEAGVPGGAVTRLGDLHAEHAQRRHATAEAALATIVERGIFRVDRVREYSFRRYAGSIEELRAWVARRSTDAYVDEATAEAARTALGCHAAAELWLREQVLITTLWPVSF